ncbi:UDP-N-acetylmuramoyl-L-alanyl-D-glutamate--2,6-diaminopimelate ligase [Candidatus Trichorickettsia mobilis]|uniref:UDP-N-acetylmuramoyl-L-alanyl-D-glutamate--2,6-diaminopimelate ligase n=1 Tax=Candidatus Trichorickettsia mobilis TaxID=1346319 RepID=A0ABZ0UTF7_9RICK|nr:UDP-N-acetylmuramoyl-L-alanyl-D-glutamate--2,6-diaminopimelate ligase [Candidatus Trichorickettsia mobilis]WPY00372.1 UDP-N-acetylmuramoyl-L-alanyl-D-glutamate--2,6-diaminopimelate ligase [Candidatus Trichorickettsia mobilis]
MKYKLQQLFKEYNIIGLSFDSRSVKPGDAFFAIVGEHVNGNHYLQQAFNAGAQLVITDDPEQLLDQRIVCVDDVRIALSYASSIFYPKIPEHLIAVTGTNGKTSVVAYIRQLFGLLGQRSASIGTLGIELNREINNNIDTKGLTTVDVLTFRKILNDLADNNINYVAFEASSHGLQQKRIYDIPVIAAGFTSFSQDHLDYHLTMDEYLNAKLKLFTENLLPDGIAVINADIVNIDFIKSYLNEQKIQVITVGTSGDVRIIKANSTVNRQAIEFSYLGEIYNIYTEIIGSFQGINLLIAAILVHQAGFVFADIVKKLPLIRAVRGRLERVTDKSHSFHIFVDYAHTPDALANSLLELKKLLTGSGKLKVVFGCGGNRDQLKRPIMGKIAAEIADVVIITDDNPRDEDPAAIRQEILAEAKSAIEIPNRKQAIIDTVKWLQAEDILLIAGKGHENYQIIGNQVIAMDDVEIARQALGLKV